MAFGQRVLARLAVSMPSLRKNGTKIIKQMGDDPVAIIEGGRITAYLMSAAAFERMQGRTGRAAQD